ncbi:MAG: hypothetical protein ISS41_07320 [Candidatus Aminicenantes bacterium]|nr:hypothetical protein [Candidatus Aminicenantes bacterium]
MIKKLIEIFDCDGVRILSERKTKDGDSMNVLFPFTQTDEELQNKRIYPKALMQREIARVQKDIEEGGFLGTADHPKSGRAELESVSHIIQKAWLDKNGKGWAEMKILPTTKGKNLQTIIREGGRLGVSTRGFGTVDDITRKVNDDYKLMGIDIVCNPSYEAGTFTKDNVFESVNFENPKENVAKLEQKMIDMLREFWGMDNSFSGDFEAYREKYEGYARKTMGLEKLGEKQRLEAIKKTKRKKVEAKDVFYEARMLGMTSKEYAEKINAGIAEEEATITLDEKDRSILRDAKSTGLDTSTSESREKILREWKQRESHIPKTKTLTEKAKILSEQTGAKIEVVVEMLEEEEEKKKAEKERVAELARINEQKHMAGANRPSLINAPLKL